MFLKIMNLDNECGQLLSKSPSVIPFTQLCLTQNMFIVTPSVYQQRSRKLSCEYVCQETVDRLLSWHAPLGVPSAKHTHLQSG